MLKLIPYLGASAGGSLGWWLGRHVGLFTAYFACVVLAAVGLYFGRRLMRRILGE